MRRAWLALILACAPVSAVWADVPDAQQSCRLHNAALCRTGDIEFIHDGPCPADAITLRPPGREPCGEAFPRERPTDRPERPTRPDGEAQANSHTVSPAAAAGKTDDDWTLSAGLMISLATLLAVAVALLQRLLRRLQQGQARLSLSDLATIVAGGIGGFWVAWQGASFAFAQVAAHFHNNDSAGPGLIGALAALIVFTLLLPLASSLITFVLFRLQDRLRR